MLSIQTRRFISVIFSLAFFIFFSLCVVWYVSGYKYRPKDKEIVKTSILNFPFSIPDGVLYIDSKKIERKFPIALNLDSGFYNILIERPEFYSWHKRVFLEEDKVTTFEKIFLAPKVFRNEFFAWKLDLKQYQIFHVKEAVFDVLDKNNFVVYTFDLNRSERKMRRNVMNIPVKTESILKADDENILFQRKNKILYLFNIKKNTGQDVTVSDLKDNILPKFELSVFIGKFGQRLSVENGKLYLFDENGANKIALFKMDSDFFAYNEDKTYFAFIADGAFRIFSPERLNEDSSKNQLFSVFE